MFHPFYERVLQFVSEGEFRDELQKARAEFVDRTGDLFESDDSYERRIGAFLEWYVLDRRLSFNEDRRPIEIFAQRHSEGLSSEETHELGELSRTVLSLFEFKRLRPGTLRVLDLLSGEKHEVYERRKPAGLEVGDIMEARLVPRGEKIMFSEAISVHPRVARRAILKLTKRYRKEGKKLLDDPPDRRLDLVHRVSYLNNRCERYSHVDPKQIFSELG